MLRSEFHHAPQIYAIVPVFLLLCVIKCKRDIKLYQAFNHAHTTTVPIRENLMTMEVFLEHLCLKSLPLLSTKVTLMFLKT